MRTTPERDANNELVNVWDATEGRWLGQAEYPRRDRAEVPSRRCGHTLPTGSRCPFWAAAPFSMCSRHLEVSDRLKVLGATRYEAALAGKDSTFRDKFGAFLMDVNLGDLTPELALQRTLLNETLAAATETGGPISKEYISALTYLIGEVANLADKYNSIASKRTHSLTPTQIDQFVADTIEAIDSALEHVLVRFLGGIKENEPLIAALKDGVLTTLADTMERTVGVPHSGRSAGEGRPSGKDLRALEADGRSGAGSRQLGAGSGTP